MQEENTEVHSLKSFHSELTLLRSDFTISMREIANTFKELVKVQERQFYMTKAYEAIERKLERTNNEADLLESRVDVLEKDAPLQRQTSKWVMTAVWSVVGLAATALLKLTGIL